MFASKTKIIPQKQQKAIQIYCSIVLDMSNLGVISICDAPWLVKNVVVVIPQYLKF